MLEAIVPYGEAAMIAYLGGRPDQFCAPETARAMAAAAWHRREVRLLGGGLSDFRAATRTQARK